MTALVFQVDLFSARGNVPGDLIEAEERKKHIVYSSRTRLNTDNFREKHALRQAIVKFTSVSRSILEAVAPIAAATA